jgi:hypothetical protein
MLLSRNWPSMLIKQKHIGKDALAKDLDAVKVIVSASNLEWPAQTNANVQAAQIADHPLKR